MTPRFVHIRLAEGPRDQQWMIAREDQLVVSCDGFEYRAAEWFDRPSDWVHGTAFCERMRVYRYAGRASGVA